MREVFMSYAWGGESEEIADAIEQVFQENEIKLVRDKTDLGYKGLIKQFMQDIGQGKCVVAIISDKYLKSKNCMYELLEISRNGNFYERIFPIVLKDARIYDPLETLNYIKYWEDKIKELDKGMKGVGLANLQGITEKINLYAEIRTKIAALVDTLQNMNTLTPEMHREGDFGEVIKAVLKRLDEDATSWQLVNNNSLRAQEMSEFEKNDTNKIEGETKVMTVDLGIIVALREEFRVLFDQLPSPQAIFDKETGVTDYLFDWGQSLTYRCAATFVGDMGLEKAALATDRFIKRCQPKTIVMLGIAGGINKDVKLGDVVVVTTANNYLHKGKAIPGENNTFIFEMGGDTYRCSDDLVRASQDLEFSPLYQQWQNEAKARREAELPSIVLPTEFLREKPEFINGAIASGPVVGAAQEFTDWLKKGNRNFLALEMEGGGMLSAIYSHVDPKKTFILRGISDFGDERKQELDSIGGGKIRRYAMNNAILLLWKLLDAEILPKNHEVRSDVSNPGETPGETPQKELTGEQKSRLQQAILKAYPQEDDLTMVLEMYAECQYNQIKQGINYRIRIFNLIQYFEVRNEIPKLVKALIKDRPNNTELKKFSQA